MIEIKNLTKRYNNGKIGVQDINLTINAGDIYAFIGPNGSGKTTTIKCVVGIHDISSGDCLINGISIKTNPIECKKQMAYIPDQPDIYPTLTGIQFLRFVCDIYSINKAKSEKYIEEYAKLLEIDKDLNSAVSTYSHGMRQKLALVSALSRKPKILILDEPFVGLDPSSSFKLKEVMQKFTADGGAIFFSTHVLEVAEKLCNKVAIIKNGKIIKQGTMAEVKKDKSLEQVFLGEVVDGQNSGAN